VESRLESRLQPGLAAPRSSINSSQKFLAACDELCSVILNYLNYLTYLDQMNRGIQQDSTGMWELGKHRLIALLLADEKFRRIRVAGRARLQEYDLRRGDNIADQAAQAGLWRNYAAYAALSWRGRPCRESVR
jgi:hypothetical protein